MSRVPGPGGDLRGRDADDRNVATDWVARDDVRAKIRSTIKRLLAKHGYPPDAEADAIKRVLDQMETFADDWSPEA
jgi:type I restriction enzyme R subunit